MIENADVWAVVELMGHRRLAGRVSEEERFGAKMLRLDVPLADGKFATSWYGAAALYGVQVVSEDAARAVARANAPQPVSAWELPKPSEPVKSRAERGLCEGIDQSCVLVAGHTGECTDDEADVATCDGCGAKCGPGGPIHHVPSAEADLCDNCRKPDESQAVAPGETCGARGIKPSGPCVRPRDHDGACDDDPPEPSGPLDTEAAAARVEDAASAAQECAAPRHGYTLRTLPVGTRIRITEDIPAWATSAGLVGTFLGETPSQITPPPRYAMRRDDGVPGGAEASAWIVGTVGTDDDFAGFEIVEAAPSAVPAETGTAQADAIPF